jgi:hypothetical protein
MSKKLHPLTVKAYGQREVELDTASAKDGREVMLGITGVGQYEHDRYAFLEREGATQLRDWLNAFLDTGNGDELTGEGDANGR